MGLEPTTHRERFLRPQRIPISPCSHLKICMSFKTGIQPQQPEGWLNHAENIATHVECICKEQCRRDLNSHCPYGLQDESLVGLTNFPTASFEIEKERGIWTLEEIGPDCADAIPLGFVYLFPPPYWKLRVLQELHPSALCDCREGWAHMQGYSLEFTIAHFTFSCSKLDSKFG